MPSQTAMEPSQFVIERQLPPNFEPCGFYMRIIDPSTRKVWALEGRRWCKERDLKTVHYFFEYGPGHTLLEDRDHNQAEVHRRRTEFHSLQWLRQPAEWAIRELPPGVLQVITKDNDVISCLLALIPPFTSDNSEVERTITRNFDNSPYKPNNDEDMVVDKFQEVPADLGGGEDYEASASRRSEEPSCNEQYPKATSLEDQSTGSLCTIDDATGEFGLTGTTGEMEFRQMEVGGVMCPVVHVREPYHVEGLKNGDNAIQIFGEVGDLDDLIGSLNNKKAE